MASIYTIFICIDVTSSKIEFRINYVARVAFSLRYGNTNKKENKGRNWEPCDKRRQFLQSELAGLVCKWNVKSALVSKI